MSSPVSSCPSTFTALSLDSADFTCTSPLGKNSFSYSPCNPSPLSFTRRDDELFFAKGYERKQASISVEDVTSNAAKRALKTLCRDWKGASAERLSHHRIQKRELLAVLNATENEGKTELLADIETRIKCVEKCSFEDKKITDNYSQLCTSMQGVLEKQLSNTAENPAAASKHFRVLMDQEGNSQSIAMYSITTDRPGLYLDYMVTSPHNLLLNAPPSDEIIPFRGAGTIMIHSFYESAKMYGLPLFYLKCADEASSTFYHNIGMLKGDETSEIQDHYYFHVTDEYPAKLQDKLQRCVEASFGKASGK